MDLDIDGTEPLFQQPSIRGVFGNLQQKRLLLMADMWLSTPTAGAATQKMHEFTAGAGSTFTAGACGCILLKYPLVNIQKNYDLWPFIVDLPRFIHTKWWCSMFFPGEILVY